MKIDLNESLEKKYFFNQNEKINESTNELEDKDYFGMTKEDWYDWANNEYQETYSEAWPDDEDVPELDKDIFYEWLDECISDAESESDLYMDLGERIFNAVY